MGAFAGSQPPLSMFRPQPSGCGRRMADAPSWPLGTHMSYLGKKSLDASLMKLVPMLPPCMSLLPMGGLPMASLMLYLYVGLHMRSR